MKQVTRAEILCEHRNFSELTRKKKNPEQNAEQRDQQRNWREQDEHEDSQDKPEHLGNALAN